MNRQTGFPFKRKGRKLYWWNDRRKQLELVKKFPSQKKAKNKIKRLKEKWGFS